MISLLSLSLLATTFASFALGTRYERPPVVFPITLTWEKGAPDGFERDMIFMNGQFPGPTLNLEEGDNVEFIVQNQMPFETTVHFHGIEQKGSPWSDGVPGLSQKAIQPGCSFVYKWTATQYGTYFYHSHSFGQLEDGLYGPIYIKPAENKALPFNMISNDTTAVRQLECAMDNPEIVVLSDWSHFTSQALSNISIAANIDPLCGDSMLINGKGNVNCPGVPFLMSLLPPPLLPLLSGMNLTDKGCLPAMDLIAQTTAPHNFDLIPPGVFSGCNATNSPLATIKADPKNGWISLNLISVASLQEMVVSIDDHSMWVYAIDGRFIEPQQVEALTLSHGSRHSVMVELNKPAQDYTIRVAGDGLNQKIFVSGTLSYIGGKKINVPNPSINYAGANTTANVTFFEDASIVPFPPVHPAQVADQTYKLQLSRFEAAYEWTLNDDTPFDVTLEDIAQPLLFNPNALANSNLTITTKNGTWVDIILLVTNSSGLQPPHPIHKHSNKAHIIGQGTGSFPWPDVASAQKAIPSSFNLDNPPYRDIFYTLPVAGPSTWTAIRYHVVNPGAFFMHCHIDPHLTGGMGIAILDGIDKWPTIPEEYEDGRNGF